MPDPTTHTAVAVATGASSASIAAGTFLGVEYIIIGLAILGATIAHIWLEQMPIKKMLVSIFGSTVLGVVAAVMSTAPVIATAIHFAPWLVGTLHASSAGGQALVAFVVSFTAQKGVPLFFNWMDSKGGKK